jgi:hypothetical protein
LSTAAKVQLVEQIQDVAGLAPALRALELARSTWYYRVQHPRPYEERHAALRSPLERIARAHPDYGYRRTTTELSEQLDRPINRKWCGACPASATWLCCAGFSRHRPAAYGRC